jgi:CRP-like cAMP-binding protein
MNNLWSNIFSRRKKASNDPRQILAEIPIFCDLRGSEIREIEHIVHVRKYEPGEFVFQEGDVGAGMFIIAKGRIDIILESREEDGAPKRLATLGERDFFGELSLLDSDRRSATAKASEASILIGLFRPDLLDLIERNPRLGSKVLINVARIIGERLRVTDARLMGDIPDETVAFEAKSVIKQAEDTEESKEADNEA